MRKQANQLAPSPCQTAAVHQKAGDHDADFQTPSLKSDSPNASSPIFHAKPLPRLGCGGPTQAERSETDIAEQQNAVNQPVQIEHATLSTECAHDQSHGVDQGSEQPAGPTQESEDDFVKGMVHVAQQVESQKATFKRGGVPGFSTGTECKEE